MVFSLSFCNLCSSLVLFLKSLSTKRFFKNETSKEERFQGSFFSLEIFFLFENIAPTLTPAQE